jgi:hypothetical protein
MISYAILDIVSGYIIQYIHTHFSIFQSKATISYNII